MATARTSLPVIDVLKHDPVDEQRPVRVLFRDDHQPDRVRLLRSIPPTCLSQPVRGLSTCRERLGRAFCFPLWGTSNPGM